MSTIFYMDRSGKTRTAKTSDWKHRIWDGSRGRYGFFTQFNIDPVTLAARSYDAPVYAGDGFNWTWHIKYSADTV